MSVESLASKIVYSGNDATTVFPVPFPYSRPEHLNVIVTNESGVREESTNFRIEQLDSGNTNIIYPLSGDPLTSAERLTIYRQTPRTQILDLIYGGAFSPETLETDGFDRLCMMIQELGEEIDRTLRLPIDTTESGKLETVFAQLNEYRTACANLLDQVKQAASETQKFFAETESTVSQYATTAEQASQDAKNTNLGVLIEQTRNAQTVDVSGNDLFVPGNSGYINIPSGSPRINLANTLPDSGYWIILVGNANSPTLVQESPSTGEFVTLATLSSNTVYLVRHMGRTQTFFLLQLSSGNTLLRAW